MKYLGQVFTPDHIADFMCRLLDVNEGDNVLDACCGNGNLLVAASKYKANCFGIELDKYVYTNTVDRLPDAEIINADTLSDEAKAFIKEHNITKVQMNPPYEDKWGCLKIIHSVLDSVPEGTLCIFLLPDNKLLKDKKKELIKKHCLEYIIKLPDIFKGNASVYTSLFVFTAHKEQKEDIPAYYMEDDGMIFHRSTKERLDDNNAWTGIMNEWVDIIKNEKEHESKALIKKDEDLMWRKELSAEDMMPTMDDLKETVSSYMAWKIKTAIRETNPDPHGLIYHLYLK